MQCQWERRLAPPFNGNLGVEKERKTPYTSLESLIERALWKSFRGRKKQTDLMQK